MGWLAELVSRKTPRMDEFYAKRRAETEENNRLARQLTGFEPISAEIHSTREPR